MLKIIIGVILAIIILNIIAMVLGGIANAISK